MATWGANNATSSFSVTITDATNSSGDISSPFTPWPGPGTGILYLDLLNNGSQDVTFGTTPAITITSTNTPFYPGTSCNLIAYTNAGGNSPSWQIVGSAPVAPSGATLSFPGYTIPGQTVDLPPANHQYPGIQCQ
jgi:hypothetical protein